MFVTTSDLKDLLAFLEVTEIHEVNLYADEEGKFAGITLPTGNEIGFQSFIATTKEESPHLTIVK